MPNQPKTPTHSVRVPQDVWDAAQERAKSRGETLTDAINRFLKRYGKEDRPPRPNSTAH